MIEGITKEELKIALKVIEAFEARARDEITIAMIERVEAETTDANVLAGESIDYFTNQLRQFSSVGGVVFAAMKRTPKAA